MVEASPTQLAKMQGLPLGHSQTRNNCRGCPLGRPQTRNNCRGYPLGRPNMSAYPGDRAARTDTSVNTSRVAK